MRASSEGGDSSPALVLTLCLFLILGLVQVFRPQSLWRLNSRMQRGWVKNPEGTEPTRKGYAVGRVTGALFLAFATWMLIRQL
ncbi:hypothetical protein GCM10010503_35820 [Streptomyces lucensis JCM 4490]|uniref:DUF6199 domain-containing protein n=1 Tax=Streptomyces lucensis JCM 4490 TaxID=1306176 RepID=A0A918J839_9ACTN|nr:hypothetical protein GCM10010503_35820 [Streptomyces lucensis JCM 4490]